MPRLFAALFAVALVGCGEAVFQCSNSGDCTGGFCEPNGYCSFDDPQCPSGRRYGEFAGDGLAGTCTPVGDDGTGSSGTQPSTDPSTSTSSSSASTGSSAPDPSTTTSEPTSSPPDTTMMVEDDSTSEPGGTTDGTTSDDPSSSSTGPRGPFTMSFGDRDDADVQDVTRDSLIADWDQTINGGAHPDVHISSSEVGLLEIDVSSLPDAAQVSEVELHIFNMDAVADGEIEMYRVTEGWDEGTADLGAGVCNWIDREEGVPWTSPGVGEGSHDDELLDTFAPDEAFAEYVLSIPAEVVEQWRDDPGDNHGLMFRSSNLSTLVWFASHEAGEQSYRPLLVVTYYE